MAPAAVCRAAACCLFGAAADAHELWQRRLPRRAAAARRLMRTSPPPVPCSTRLLLRLFSLALCAGPTYYDFIASRGLPTQMAEVRGRHKGEGERRHGRQLPGGRPLAPAAAPAGRAACQRVFGRCCACSLQSALGVAAPVRLGRLPAWDDCHSPTLGYPTHQSTAGGPHCGVPRWRRCGHHDCAAAVFQQAAAMSLAALRAARRGAWGEERKASPRGTARPRWAPNPFRPA